MQRKEKVGKKPAVMIVSSVLGRFDNGVYAATKAFASNLAVSLSYSMNDIVDVMAYEPGMIDTKMIAAIKDQGALLIRPEQAADSSFRDLGIQRQTFGHRRHYQVYSIFSMFPSAAHIGIAKGNVAMSKKYLEDNKPAQEAPKTEDKPAEPEP